MQIKNISKKSAWIYLVDWEFAIQNLEQKLTWKMSEWRRYILNIKLKNLQKQYLDLKKIYHVSN